MKEFQLVCLSTPLQQSRKMTVIVKFLQDRGHGIKQFLFVSIVFKLVVSSWCVHVV